MNKILLWLSLIVMAFGANPLGAQISADSATAPNAVGVQDVNSLPNINSVASCADTLTVSVPAGNWIYGIDVFYTVNTVGGFTGMSPSGIYSYLECLTTGTKETQVYNGTNFTLGASENFSRTNLNFANGPYPGNSLEFRLHAFDIAFFSTGCDTADAKIQAGTFKVVVRHGPPITCFAPTNFQLDYATSDKARLSWNSSGSNSQLEYGSPGFTLGNGTRISTGNKDVLISGLTALTTYEAYVRDSCSANDTSLWTGPISFSTLCNPQTFTTRFTENFDGAGWTSGTNAQNANNTIGNCWTRNPAAPGTFGGDFAWGTGTGATPSASTGPNTDLSGTGNYIYTEASAGANQDLATISSPMIDLTPLSNPALNFSYHRFGGSVGELRVEILEASQGWQTVWSQGGPQNQSASSDPWINEILPLPAYQNDTIRVRFTGIRSFTFDGDLAIDELILEEAPSCPDPINLRVNARGVNSLELTWTSVNASSWLVEYGSPGFSQGNGTTVTANSNPFTLSGLSAGQDYDIYLRSICGPADSSDWVGPLSSATLCNALSAPYAENFDQSPWQSGTGTYNTGDALDPCWFRQPQAGSAAVDPVYWGVRDQSGTTPNTGPDNDVSGNGNFLYIESSAGSQGQTAVLESPLIDLSALTIPELRFSYHMFGDAMGSLALDVYSQNSGSWNAVWQLSGEQQTAGSDPWQQVKLNFAAYAGDSIVLRFRGIKGNERRGDLAIDEISLDERPACPEPDSLQVLSVSSNSVQLSWLSGGASSWQIEYGPQGFVPGSGTLISAGTNPFTVAGLNASQTYDFYVRDSCGPANYSIWTGPVSATMPCGIATAPWLETFDNSDWIPGTGIFNGGNVISSCWSRPGAANPDFGPNSGPSPSGGTGPSADLSGNGNYLYTEFSGGVTGPGEITSPQIHIPTSLSSPTLQFSYHMNGAAIDSLQVAIDNGTGFSRLLSIVGAQQTAENDPWQQQQLALGAYSGDTVQLRFLGYSSGFAGDIAIDEVGIQNITCPQPSNLQAALLSPSVVQLSWNTGGSSNWQISYGSPGFLPANGTIINTSSNPANVSGLSPNVTYEFYLRDSCGLNDFSPWIGPVQITTPCAVVTAPVLEDFNGPTWVPGTAGGLNTNNQIDACWQRPSAANPNFGTNTGATPSGTTGPGSAFGGSGNYLYTEYSGGASGIGEISSPLIAIPATFTNPQLQFAYHMYGLNIDSLQVLTNTGAYVGSIVGSQQSAAADPWQLAQFDLSAYLNDTVGITFRAHCSGFAGDIAIDDFEIYDLSCPRPDSLHFISNTSSSITLGWNSGGASNWQIEYGPVGFTLGQGTLVNAATNPFTISGLQASANYDIYVRDSCAPGDVSIWQGPLLAATLCDTILAPYTENFDIGFDRGTDFGTAQNVGSTISPCWSRNRDTLYFWGGGTGGTPTNGTGPFSDNTSGSGNYVFVESSFAAGGATADLFTPWLNLDSLAFPELRFWYHMWTLNGSQGKLVWSINDGGSTWTPLDSLDGDQGFGWFEMVTDLRPYTGQTVQIRFRATKSTGPTPQQGDIALDDLSLINGPACPDPDSLALTNRGLDFLEIDWYSPSATNYLVRWQALGGGGATINPVSSKPHRITGLNGSTAYVVCVKDSCGPGQSSAWLCDTFETLCSPLVAPVSENFDGASWQPGAGALNTGSLVDNCWIRPNGVSPDFATGSGATPSAGTGPLSDVSGPGKYIYSEYSGGNPAPGEILSPYIALPGTFASPELRFSYHMFGGDIDSLVVQAVNTSGQRNRLLSIIGAQQSANGDPYRVSSASLVNYLNDTVAILFQAYGQGFASDIAIDEFSVDDPSCPAPDSLRLTNIGVNSATVNWNNIAANSQLEYGLSGFNLGSGTRVNSTGGPFTISGLAAGTLYDVYVRDSCGSNDTSLWVGPLTFATNCTVFSAPFTENFDAGFQPGSGFENAGSTIGPCWSRTPDSLFSWGGGQGATTSGGTGPTADHTSGNGFYVYTEATAGNAGDTAILLSPTIDLSPLNNPELVFWLHQFSNSSDPSLRVEIAPLGGSWTLLDTIEGDQGNFWNQQQYSLQAFANQTVQVRFIAVKPATGATFQNDIAIDDLSIDERPLCAAFNLPFQENFDGNSWSEGSGALNNGDQIDPCWIRQLNTSAQWGAGTGPTASNNTGPNTDISGSGGYIYLEASRGNGSAWINSPRIFIDSSFNKPTLYFSHHQFGANIDSLKIQVISNGSLSAPLFQTAGQQLTAQNIPWDQDSVDLSAYRGDTIQIRFVAVASGFAGDVAIDGVELDEGFLPCAAPSNLSLTNISPTEVEVSWSSNNNQANTRIIFWPLGSGISNSDTLSGASSPVIVSPLSANTTYVFALEDSCVNGLLSSATLDSITTIPCPPVSAAFNFTPNLLTVSFDGSGSTNADSLYWNFGDGTNGRGANITHSYTTPGTYPVRLIVANDCGSTDTLIQNVVVCDSLIPDIQVSTLNDTLFFDASGSTGANRYRWQFGDGNTSNQAQGTHQYGNNGTFIVSLTIGNACGDSLTVFDTVAVCAAPIPFWTYTILPPTGSGLRIQFDGSGSQNAISYAWDFGDGNTATGPTPIHVYSTPGLFYTVTLTVTNDCGQEAILAVRLSDVNVNLPEVSRSSLAIYPNPAERQLSIESERENPAVSLRLFDLGSKQVFETSRKDREALWQLSLPDLPEGLYWLEVRLKSGEAVRQKLLIRQH